MTRPSARPFTIGGRRIGGDAPCFIVAEIGINHNGDRIAAMQLIDAAVAAGADAVKFQKRTLSETYRDVIVTNPRRAEQGVQYLVPLLKEFELSDADFRSVRAHCAAREIPFLCTPWDMASVEFLEGLDVAAYKIGSPDLTNLPLIDRVVTTGRPIVVSTGMASEEEIRRTLAHLDTKDADYAVLHCVSSYPAAPDEINLRFMGVLREWCGRPVGYSGHEVGTAISAAAAGLGAKIIERHVTLDKTARGPDHRASLLPSEFAEQVRAIREVESALGTTRRWMTRGELLNRRLLAKSLVAAKDIAVGSLITADMVAAKSPGLGVSPQRIGELMGRVTIRAMKRDDEFDASDLRDDVAIARDATPVDVGAPWGIVARFTDLGPLERRFAPLGMRFVEFHLSDRDLDAGVVAFDGAARSYGLVVHAPEYRHDALVDLCAENEEARRSSVDAIQRAINLTRELASRFALDPALFPHGPKVIVHPGGMHRAGESYDAAAAEMRLVNALALLDHAGVELLIENLPPFPWYFGGRWHGAVMCDAESVVRVCRAAGLGLCLDTSHAALACEALGDDLGEFATVVQSFVRHLHVSDAAGVSGEGLQIGGGAINFVKILPPLVRARPTLVPEVWMGHHNDGEAFRAALEHLTDLRWAAAALDRPTADGTPGGIDSLIVGETATLLGVLRVIDLNRMGIAFVLRTDRHVEGVVTDGDIRHALVRGLGLHSSVTEAMSRTFVSGSPDMTNEELRARLPGRTRVMPVLDAAGRLVDVANLWTVGDAVP